MSSLGYSIKQAFKNIFRNPLHSFAAVATVATCIFLFGAFYSLTVNLQSIITEAETNIGITVFFDEGLSDAEKEEIRQDIEAHGNVRRLVYTSADEAWENFKAEYFGDRADELSKAFEDDNPLADSDSYEIFMENIDDQEAMVSFLKERKGVREVNYLSSVISTLKKVNYGVYAVSIVITGLLILVSVFLISNSISVAASFRKRENEIMKLIGATDFLIRAPFVIEGIVVGALGAGLSLLGIYLLYTKGGDYLTENVLSKTSGVLGEVLRLIPVGEVFPTIAMCGAALGIGMGAVVSFFTIRKHLRV
ncbi:MAG: permease-like cell division protein FtsX [Eubacteriales bacterium]|nr:permease-like cell division protein FtsX [Eubacteriales bacterium]